MVEGDGFDEFLDSWAELALVAPAVYAQLFWDDGFEEGIDLVEADLVLLGDLGWEGLVGCANSLQSENTKSVSSVEAIDSETYIFLLRAVMSRLFLIIRSRRSWCSSSSSRKFSKMDSTVGASTSAMIVSLGCSSSG